LGTQRRLGIDFGSARIGVALSDELGFSAQPLEVIQAKKQNAVARIATLTDEYNVVEIVLGLPLTLLGDRGPAAEKVEKFARALEAKVSVPIVLWDERLTTAECEKLMISAGVSRKRRKEKIDKLAATVILQSYLDAASISSADLR